MPAKLLPALSEDSEETLAVMAERPQAVWDLQVRQMPELMKKVDLMLAGGITPEWIMQRGAFFDLPVSVQTVFLNALHWRQKELQRREKGG